MFSLPAPIHSPRTEPNSAADCWGSRRLRAPPAPPVRPRPDRRGSADAAFRATRGVYVPGGARAGEADATAVELNPGQLPLLARGAVAVVADVWRAQAALAGRGAALFLAAPLCGAAAVSAWACKAVGGSGAGAGCQRVRLTKLQLGYGVGGRTLGVGISWAHLFGGGIGGTDTFDVGAGWRPFGPVAAALVLEDFARPRLPGAAERLPRRWVGEVVLRPLGTERWEVAAAALHLAGDSWSSLGARFRMTGAGAGPLAPAGRGGVGAAPFGWCGGPGGERRRLARQRRRGGRLRSWFADAGRPAGLHTGGCARGQLGRLGNLRAPASANSPSASPPHAVRISLEGIDSDREFLIWRCNCVASPATARRPGCC